MEDPKASLDESLSKSKEIVVAVQHLQRQQEAAEQNISKEIQAHAATKDQVKALEAMLRQREQEFKEQALKLEQENRACIKLREDLQRAKDDAHTTCLQNDALKVEMEAKEKAYVVSVNWAARCNDLQAKYDRFQEEYDSLLEENIKMKSTLRAAQDVQEEYRQQGEAAVRALETSREELAKRNQLADEVAGRLAELEAIKAQWAAQAVSKSRGRSKALAVLERNLAQGDQGLISSSFAGWSTITQAEKTRRLQKDKAMQRATRTIASEGTALMSTVFGPWAKEAERAKRAALRAVNAQLEGAQANAGSGAARAHQRAIAQLEKQFAGEDQSLVRRCLDAWKTGRAARKKKDQSSQKAARMIANSDVALKSEIFQIWNGCCQESRAKKQAKEASSQKALRMIANSDGALRTEVFNIWLGIIEKIRQSRKGKEASTAKAMRMIANSDNSLMNICFDAWAKVMQQSKESKRAKDQSNKKALRMIANSDGALQTTSLQAWAAMCVRKKQKEQNTAKAVRMIASSNAALQAAVFSSWANDMRKRRDKSKKMKALEKTLGATSQGLQMLTLTSWHAAAQADARRKRAKERSMKTAMKSITGDHQLLQVHIFLTWVRQGLNTRLLALQASLLQAQEVAEQAQAAMEDAAGKAQDEDQRLRAEVQSLSQQYSAAVCQVEEVERKLAETGSTLEQKEDQLSEVLLELEESRRKARDIGEELSKVGIFLQSVHPPQTPRRQSRPNSGKRSAQSPRATRDKNALPRIETARGEPREPRGEHRPRSGARKWNKPEPPMPPPTTVPMPTNSKLIDAKLDAVAALEAKLEAKLAWTEENF